MKCDGDRLPLIHASNMATVRVTRRREHRTGLCHAGTCIGSNENSTRSCTPRLSSTCVRTMPLSFRARDSISPHSLTLNPTIYWYESGAIVADTQTDSDIAFADRYDCGGTWASQTRAPSTSHTMCRISFASRWVSTSIAVGCRANVMCGFRTCLHAAWNVLNSAVKLKSCVTP